MKLFRSIRSHYGRLVLKSWLAAALVHLPPQWRQKLTARRRLLISLFENGLCLQITPSDSRYDRAVWSPDLQGWTDASAADELLSLAPDHFIDLRVSDNYILNQIIVLPRLAGENLDEAVAFGLSTWTPFQADEVYFAACPIARDCDQITVSIKYALQARLKPLIDQVSVAILPPDRLAFEGGEHWTVLLNKKKKQRINWQQRCDAGLVAAAVALALILVLAASWRQEDELVAYQTALRREVSLLAKEDAIRKASEVNAVPHATVAQYRAEHYSISEVMAGLAQHLPPDAFVLDLEVNGSKGRVEIGSADSTALADALIGVSAMADVQIEDFRPGRPVTVLFTIPRISP
ncbi:hypothetical protein [Microvirga sp. G4-2]|uniref:hypothetical protein n=1 Tax=Microvirga sp. G4-2 TaxID=3434467 RepID=UPI004044586E